MSDIKRKGFILYMDKLNRILPELNDREAGELLKSMYYYNSTGKLPENISKTTRMAVSGFLLDFDRDFERYKRKIGGSVKVTANASKWAQMSISEKILAVRNELSTQVADLVVTDFLNYEFSVITDWFSGKYSPKNWLLLTGCSGSGKTVLAKSICLAYNKINFSTIKYSNQSCNWIIKSSIELAEAITNSKQNDTYTRIQNTGKLCIDNLGIEPLNQYVYGNKRNAISEILLYRYDKNLPTIITSNLSFDSQIEKRYGTMIYDRLLEKSVVIKFENQSFRTYKKNNT